MSDFSVKSSSVKKDVKSQSSSSGEFSKLNKEYNNAKKKMQRTDFANSPVALEKELALLHKLKEAAQKEGLEQEIKQIEEKEQSIYKQLANNFTQPVPTGFFSQMPIHARPYTPNNRVSFGASEKDYVAQFTEQYSDIPLDDNAHEVIKIWGQNDFDNLSMLYVLRRTTDEKGFTPQDKFEAVNLFATSGFSSSIMPQLLEDLVVEKNGKKTDEMDINACLNACEFKDNGFDDYSSLKLAKLLKTGFDNEESIFTNIDKMHEAGIDTDAIIDIINTLKVHNPETGEYHVNSASIQALTRIKKSLTLTRDNEKKERENPINTLGVQKYDFGGTIMIVKDGKITYVTPVEGETVHSLQEKYDELISKIEDDLLNEFAKKYKDKNGEINSSYTRTLVALRRQGITYGQLINMVDQCVSKDGEINKNAVETISTLKKAGALSDDIPVILASLEQNPDGTYNEEDIANAVNMTSQFIGGAQIAELLAELRGDETLKEFINEFPQFANDKQYVMGLVSLIKDSSGYLDEYAMRVVSNLAENTAAYSNKEEFMSIANSIVSASKNKDEETVSEIGECIVAIMCRHNKSAQDILTAIELCRDKNGVIDEKLSDIVWDMTGQGADISNITDVISACKKDNEINYNTADIIISLLDSKFHFDKILEFLNR